MALSLEKIKKDFVRNQKRTAILGVLVLVLAGFSVKAYFEMAPSHAAADTGAPVDPVAGAATTADVQLSAAESEARIRQSKQLWTALREVKKDSVTPAFAFTFLPANFPEDPNRPRQLIPERLPDNNTQPTTSVAHDLEPARRKAEITAKANHITVTSTVLGNPASKSVVLLNIARPGKPGQQGIYKVGDVVEGFEITAIQARKVVLKMEDIEVIKGMSGSSDPSMSATPDPNAGGAEPSPK